MGNVIRGFLTRRKIGILDWIVLSRFNKQSPELRQHCIVSDPKLYVDATDEEIKDANDNTTPLKNK